MFASQSIIIESGDGHSDDYYAREGEFPSGTAPVTVTPTSGTVTKLPQKRSFERYRQLIEAARI